MTLNEELHQVATTPQLERIANELDSISTQLYYKYQLLIKLDAKQRINYKFAQLKILKYELSKEQKFTSEDEILKAKLLDEIGKLILKL